MNRRDALMLTGAAVAGTMLPAHAMLRRGKLGAFSPAQAALGLNLAPLAYYSPEYPFLNVFLNCHISAGDAARNTIDWKTSTFGSYTGTIDGNGWPTQVQDGIANKILLLRSFPQANAGTGAFYRSGNYNVYYNGTGTVSYGFDATLVSHTAGPAPYDWVDVINVATPSTNGVLVQVTSTSASPNNIRNMRLVYQSDAASYLAGAIFDSGFLAKVQNFGLARFMDWHNTNNNTWETSWASRSQVTDGGYAQAVPWEIVCDLCNAANIDAWVNVPVNATTAYFSSFMTFLAANLNANLGVYIEFSNEVWNGTAQQAAAAANAVALWPSESGQAQWQLAVNYEGYMLQQICTAAVTAFGSANVGAGKRVQVLAGAQYANNGILDNVMTTPYAVANGGQALYGNFPIAGCTFAWYFNTSSAQVPASWLAKSTSQYVSDCFTEFSTGGLIPWGTAGLAQDKSTIDAVVAHMASNYGGLPCFGYEGGIGDTPNIAYAQYTNNVATAVQRSHAYTTFGAAAYVIDPDNNVQVCTTAGTTAASPPAFSDTLGATTVDGTVTWTRVQSGSGAWTASWTPTMGDVVKDSNGNFQAALAVSGATGASAPTWNTTAGGTTTDGSVTWTMLSVNSWLANMTAWSRSSDMVTCYDDVLNYWKGKGSACRSLCQYYDIGGMSQFGLWGALENYLDTVSPLSSAPYKWQACVNWAAANPRWW